MPRFVAQTLFQDYNLIASNFYIWIDFFQPSRLPQWSGSFDLHPTSQFNPNSIARITTYKVQLNDGRSGIIRIHDCAVSSHTGELNIQFNGDGTLE
jgi:hypothetical protein